jgi:hypothetical protein
VRARLALMPSFPSARLWSAIALSSASRTLSTSSRAILPRGQAKERDAKKEEDAPKRIRPTGLAGDSACLRPVRPSLVRFDARVTVWAPASSCPGRAAWATIAARSTSNSGSGWAKPPALRRPGMR